MAGEAASALGLSMAVLAERPDDAACGVASEVVLGSPFVAADLHDFAARCDVVTFDHEQVDLELVAEVAAGGAVVRPGADTLELAVDKAHMRTVLDGAGVPVPAYAVVEEGPDAPAAVEAFAAAHGWPVMLKAARGGYDGKGVWPVGDRAAAEARPGTGGADGSSSRSWCPSRPSWPSWWPAARRARRRPGRRSRRPRWAGSAGRCSCRAACDADVVEAASALGQKVAEIAGAVGVMAVELFWTGGRLLVNEVATRPHNSGHWTIEGAVTSQFENHLRAVLDLPLGSTAPQHPQVASVNVFGGAGGRRSGPPARRRPRRGGRPRPPLWQAAPARDANWGT